jgi:hypothetical protein
MGSGDSGLHSMGLSSWVARRLWGQVDLVHPYGTIWQPRGCCAGSQVVDGPAGFSLGFSHRKNNIRI